MKALHFHATAPHPQVARPLMHQASQVLRPFHRFLGQAIHTAKQRQVRYQLPWERVVDLRSLRLEPVDSLLRVPRRAPGVLLVDWPADRPADLGQQGFVPARGVAVHFEEATPTAAGLRVRTEPPLQPGDRVLWCQVDSGVRREAEPPAPQVLADAAGRPLALAAPPRPDAGGEHWLLVVEGQHDDADLWLDGAPVEAEALPAGQGLRRVVDTAGCSHEVRGGTLRTEALPAEGLLRGDDGLRYRWQDSGPAGRRGCWVQLLPPDNGDADDFLDPRAAFCEGDVREVWTQPHHRKDTVYRVKRVDPDRYQLLLDRYPPAGSTLYLPVDLRNLYLQRRALRQLAEAPLPHHQGLLRLCEDPAHVRWPAVRPVRVADDGWRSLTDPTRSGTDQQRAFVEKALGSPDLAFLEGPPGSGKTTAICELIQQLVEAGQRVLLCGSTHVAIDNVLERLLASEAPIDAVRIGRLDKVDDRVQRTQLDERVAALVAAWQALPAMAGRGEGELQAMAERTVIMAANLTCGTTMGIVAHPLFQGRDEDLRRWERPITTMPHWDVLIVDEASKTLIQEFMVPALMARRWIVVGDVRQLPPFADRADIVANLRDLVDEQDRPVFPPDHQRACLLLFRLLRRQVHQPGMRWLLVEPPGVLEHLAAELREEPAPGLTVVRLVARRGRGEDRGGEGGPVHIVTTDEVRAGAPEALALAAADWVLVAEDLVAEVAPLLPGNLLLAAELDGVAGPLDEGSALFLRQAWWLQRAGALPRPYRDRSSRRGEVATLSQAQDCERAWLQRNDLAQQLAWRLTRLHELRHSRNDRERQRLRRDLDRLQPVTTSIEAPLAEIEDIGLPSILEVLQEGIGVDRAARRSALTAGMRTSSGPHFAARFESLSYQHRMHDEIAAFPRDLFYAGTALHDANTVAERDRRLAWDFGPFPARRAWAHVAGREQGGANRDEVQVMAGVLREFLAWARDKGPPARDLPRVWEVACLCFYAKQERAISELLAELTGDDRRTRFAVRDAPVEIVCGTVDRFQGREADLVLLSLRNTARVGFLDSPNRLNVAVTRARQQLVVIGQADYFSRCGISELQELVRRSPRIDARRVHSWKRGNR